MKPFLKIYGGKFYLRNFIINECFPAHWHTLKYNELFLGGGSVFLKVRQKNGLPSILNDDDFPTYAIWNQLKYNFRNFSNRLSVLEYSENEFLHQKQILSEDYMKNDTVVIAVAKYCLLRMSRAGMCESFAWSDRIRGGQPGDKNAWDSSLAGLKAISDLLQKSTISNFTAQSVLLSHDFDNSNLVYLDPPYLKEKDGGKRTSNNGYAKDMTPEQHEDLLKIIVNSKAFVVLSGYETELYNKYLNKDSGWNMKFKDVVNHSQQQDKKAIRREVVYRNFA